MSHEDPSNIHEHDLPEEDEFDDEGTTEPSGFLNDLSFADESERIIDTSEFFPLSKTFAIHHNKGRIFSDMKSGKAKPINLHTKLSLSISKPKKQYRDILSKKDQDSPLLSYLGRISVVRISCIDLCEPLEIPEDRCIDARIEVPQHLPIRSDIYLLPIPLSTKTKRFIRRHKMRIFQVLLVGSASVALLSWGAIALASGIKTSVEDSYKALPAAMASIEHPAVFNEKVQAIQKSFGRTRMITDVFGFLLDNPLYSNDKIRTATSVVRGGDDIANAITTIASLLLDIQKEMGNPETLDYPSLVSASGSFKATNFLLSHKKELEAIDEKLSNAIGEYAKIQTLGNSAMDAKFQKGLSLLITVRSLFRNGLENLDPITEALGNSRPMRYMILNQNRDEIRATGGFAGSTMLLEFYKWRIQKYEKKDIYYYDWHLFPFAEASPPGIDRITDKFGLRDANYYPEISETFETVDRLYQKSGGSSLDGIIAINQGVLVNFLAKYGGVTIPSIGQTIDASNFSLLMSALVEAQIGRQTSAKDILFAFAGEFEKKLLAIKDYIGYIELLSKEVRSGEVLAYSREKSVESLIEKTIWKEEWKEDRGNFVYPVFTSLSANKSDRYIARKFRIQSNTVTGSGANLSQSGGSCLVSNHFSIESKHAITSADIETTRKLLYTLGVPVEKHEPLLFVQWAGRNIQYVRVILPKGSKLTGTPPVQITIDDSHTKYTTMSFYLTTELFNSSAAFFDYTSPIANCEATAKFYKQPGLQNIQVETK